MQKSRNEILDYLNGCQNCYCTVIENCNRPEVVYIDLWRIFDNFIIIAVDNDKKERLSRAQNEKISFAIWSKLEGYQIKGKIVPEKNSAEYFGTIKSYRASLADSGIDLYSKKLVLTAITDIYSVTPGKQAGESLFQKDYMKESLSEKLSR